MTQTEIENAIQSAFSNLYECNCQAHDYWITQLYELNGHMITDIWNESTLQQMEKDVMYSIKAQEK